MIWIVAASPTCLQSWILHASQTPFAPAREAVYALILDHALDPPFAPAREAVPLSAPGSSREDAKFGRWVPETFLRILA